MEKKKLNVKRNKDTQSQTEHKKEKRSRKKVKGFTIRVWRHKEHTNPIILIFALIGAMLLDLINLIKNLILGLVCIFIICGIVGTLFLWTQVQPYYKEYSKFAKEAVENSTPDTFKLDESTYIYDTNGELLVKLRGEQDSSYLNYKDIPTDVINAFIAIEDRSYWDNYGIDLKGIIRVGIDYIQTRGEEKHGASTITQQLARGTFLTREVSLERKAKEMLVAIELTKKYTKEEILEFYVNDVCFANAVFGIDAAASAYFDKKASELTLSQIAYLCAIPNSPEYYNPYKYPERALERRDKILNDMREIGFITQNECDKAKAEEIVIKRPSYSFNDNLSTYAIDCATRYIMKLNGFEFKYHFEDMTDYTNYKKEYAESYGEANNDLVSGGYKIYTTLDKQIQQDMQSKLDENLAFDEEINEETGIYALQGAVTVIDNSNGKVVAVVGGRSQELETQNYTLNRAYQSTRQPGSCIKPLVVYTPALMNGYKPTTMVQNIDVVRAKEKGVDVQSLSGTSMTLRSALEQSKNGVAWQIFDKLGAETCMSFVENMKFSSICPDDFYNSSSLGGLTNGVTTVEMAGAYSTLENNGKLRETTCIKSIIDKSEKDIYRAEDEIQIYDPYAAYTMVDMMQGVLSVGTAKKLAWSGSTKMVAACKTGTTNDNKDGWLCGFTPYYTVAVWVGYDQPRVMNNLYGATYPGNIWKDCMLNLIEYKEVITTFGEAPESELSTMQEMLDREQFLPGRSDDEVLSDGYTVGDYRNDREIGQGLNPIISSMQSLDVNDSSFTTKLQSLYTQGQNIVNQIYSRKYTAELQGNLDNAYNAAMQRAGFTNMN